MKRLIFIRSALIPAFAIISIFMLIPTVSSQSTYKRQSRLGIQGIPGYMITVVAPGTTTEQAGLKPGDIITSTSLNGQFTSIEQFQKDVAMSVPGTTIEVTYLRFNPAKSSFDEHTATVKTMPFTSRDQFTVKDTR